MSTRLFATNCPVTHCAPKRVQRAWLRVVGFVLGSLLLGWLLSGCEAAHEPVSPWLSGSVMGLLFFSTLMLIFFATRKARECDEHERRILLRPEFLAERVEKGPGVEPMMNELPADDVERILGACAAEARCIAKHVRRAQTTLSVEDYGDELVLAERKLEGVIRCVEALASRLQLAEKNERVEKNFPDGTASVKPLYEELAHVVSESATYMRGEVDWDEAGRIHRLICDAAAKLEGGRS